MGVKHKRIRAASDLELATLHLHKLRPLERTRSLRRMPTLTRFLTVVVIIGAIIYGSMLALATFVRPNTAEITERVPLKNLDPQ